MATVLVTGGSGLVGKTLCKKLQEKGYTVSILGRTRKHNLAIKSYIWDIGKEEIEAEAIDKADYIIHLAGANIGEKKWTAKRKQLIVDSRVNTGHLILKKVKERKSTIKAFISASAIGYYGTITSNTIFAESDLPSTDFLGETCRKWELVADAFKKLDTRTVKIRTSVVLTRKNGALSKMIKPVLNGIGSALGSGRQYLPWIHIDDLCGIYIKAIEDNHMNGAYNAVAPDHKTNKEFIQTIAKILNKPFWLPKIPAITIKLIYGEMSDILLKGTRISSQKIIAAGYIFQFPTLEKALDDLINN